MLVSPAPIREQFNSGDVSSEGKPEENESDELEPLQPFDEVALSKEAIELAEAPFDSGLQDLASVEKLMITKKVAIKQLVSLQSQRGRYLIRAPDNALMYSVVEENTSYQDLASVKKKVAVKQLMFLQTQRSRYLIRAPDNALMYSVVKENTWWLGFLCYGLRPCQLKIMNKAGEEVIRILRPFAFTTRVTPCQLQRMEVYSPPDDLIGTIEQQWTPMKPCYAIKGRDGEDLFSVQGPANTLGIYRDLHFEITRPDGTHIGSTWKRWRGLAHALFRSPILDKFGLAFQRDITVEEKALLLATSLLVDYMYYDT